jgi:hypothetical protein
VVWLLALGGLVLLVGAALAAFISVILDITASWDAPPCVPPPRPRLDAGDPARLDRPRVRRVRRREPRPDLSVKSEDA